MREVRKARGAATLLSLSRAIPHIPYIRLSKIERGEVFAKASELVAVGGALGIDPVDLLIDIDAGGFDIGAWAATVQDVEPVDPAADRMAVLLAAATRVRRAAEPAWTLAAIEAHGIAPVILSRIENAVRPVDRWKARTMAALCSLFGVGDVAALVRLIETMDEAGLLAAHVRAIAAPEVRIGRTRDRVAELRAVLNGDAPEGERLARSAAGRRRRGLITAPPSATLPDHATDAGGSAGASPPAPGMTIRLVPVFGRPLADGLIARVALDDWVEVPRSAGPDSYGLRIGRSTLGLGMPAGATLVIDPGRYPATGGLAVIEEREGALRLLAVLSDRRGRMMGYSESPDLEVAIDDRDPATVASVIAALL